MIRRPFRNWDNKMQQIDASFLYTTGYSIHPLDDLKAGDEFQRWWLAMYVAQSRIRQFLSESIYTLKTSLISGQKLYAILDKLTGDTNRTEPLNPVEAYDLNQAFREFEHVLVAELQMMDIYLVTNKRGYDTTSLISNGRILFPDDLPLKVPEAVRDVDEGCRCIAFELPTAAGFHLHRANESVLRRYFDAVTNGAPRPADRSMGAFIAELRNLKAGDAAVLAALQSLKDLHRNPLIHPEHSLDNVDDALALLGGIHTVVVHMLKIIPVPTPASTATASALTLLASALSPSVP